MSLLRRIAPCLLAGVLLLGMSAGCASASADLTLTVDGETSLVHYVPGSTPRPLVVVLHGLGSTGEEMARVTGLSAFADRNGFSVVYPDAHRVLPAPPPPSPTPAPSPTPTPTPTSPAPSASPMVSVTPSPALSSAVPSDAAPSDAAPSPSDSPSPSDLSPSPSDPSPSPSDVSPSAPDPTVGPAAQLQNQRAVRVRSVNEVATGAPSSSRAWNAGICCGGASGDDVAYLRRVVAAVETHVAVDRHRIYVLGLSNGGMMATRAICDAPDLFAAAGTVAGPYLGTRCGRPIWKHLHGGNDPIVPYVGGMSPGVSGLGVAVDWCQCRFPSSATEAARMRGYVAVTYVPAGTHSWPTSTGPWHLDGNTVLWQAVSVFRR